MVHVCGETSVKHYVVVSESKSVAESKSIGKFCKDTGRLPTGLFSRVIDVDNKIDP